MSEKTKEELINFICESMEESLPLQWLNATMQTTIDGHKIESNFTYTTEEGERNFQPQNPFGPMNAAREIHTLMEEEGEGWSRFVLKLTSEGDFEIYTE